MDDEQSIPKGIKIISGLYYLGAVLGIIITLLFLIGGGMMGAIANRIPLLGMFGVSIFIGIGIIIFGLSILAFFIGRGLRKRQQWARIVAILFAGLGILIAIISMIQGNFISNIFSLIINILIGRYLLLNNTVKTIFA